MKQHYDIIIHGKVQNVGFRYYTQKKANELQINGFVKNQSDGSVYIEAEGDEKELQAFLLWCHRGPQWARVDNVTANPAPIAGYNGFTVK